MYPGSKHKVQDRCYANSKHTITFKFDAKRNNQQQQQENGVRGVCSHHHSRLR